MSSTALQKTAVMQLKGLIEKDQVQSIFLEMLGKRAGAFTNSVTNVMRNSEALQKCDPTSIISAAIDAASVNLPVDPGLGFAAIVPYGTKAQFQIMYKGITQLAIRSGQYQTVHCSEIYADELLSHNPITGVVKFKDPAGYKMRAKKQDSDVIGHYAYLRLLSGFEKSDYMSHAEAMAHGEKYSKAFQYDLRVKKKLCPWSLNPIAMCNKTVYLRLLKKYGIMSVEMQDVMMKDDTFDAAQEQMGEQIAAEQGSKVVDTEFESEKAEKPLVCPACKLPYRRKGMRKTTKTCECESTIPGPVDDPPVDGEVIGDESESTLAYFCNQPKCKANFDEPMHSGTGDNAIAICPVCFSKNIDKRPF